MSAPAAPRGSMPALLAVDARGPGGAALSPTLFGVGVNLASGSYVRPGDTHCVALSDVRNDAGIALVRVGAGEADDYDWRADTYDAPKNPGHPRKASPGCPAQGPAASALRVLDRVHNLHARAVVVLNGETDDPGAAYGLVTLIARRFGVAFARGLLGDWQCPGRVAAFRRASHRAPRR